MSNRKQREYVLHGITKELVDGKSRAITLVGVVTEETDYDIEHVGNKIVETTTSEDVVTTIHTLSIGLSVVNPMDENIAEVDKGVLIARGKALKPSKALLSLNSSTPYFNDTVVGLILNNELQRIIKNPNRFIKVSVRNSKQVETHSLLDLLAGARLKSGFTNVAYKEIK
jgi:hypothetical protein